MHEFRALERDVLGDGLEEHARATWRSFVELVEPSSGLPAYYIGGDLRAETRARYTSPTNIAMYLWAIVAARDLELISEREAAQRSARVLESLARLERHDASGQFYNWYDVGTLARLTRWPEAAHGPVYPFASSVDNGWLASALVLVANALPSLHVRAGSLVSSMDFGSYYDADARGGGPGLLRGGFWRRGEEPPGSDGLPRGDYGRMGETVVYTAHHYGAFNTETRIASYLGIALGQLPREHYFAPWRTYPEAAHWPQRARPVGAWRRYLDVEVFEGAYVVGDQRLVPSWGGSMFEALMPTLVVPEARWGAHSWAVTHPRYVQAQIDFGLAHYGYWGFSPASDPDGGYREYGVPALAMEPSGYAAGGVVTPHAAFLALAIAPAAALANLAALRRDFPNVYGAGGFKDSVNVVTGRVSERYLALDQGMVMAALGNQLLPGGLHAYLARTLQPALEPLMALEEFGTRAATLAPALVGAH
jgi:hypothetical protein